MVHRFIRRQSHYIHLGSGLVMSRLFKIFSRTCSAFGSRTSIPGLSQAARSRSRLRRAYWISVMMAGLAFTGLGLKEEGLVRPSNQIVVSKGLITRAISCAISCVICCKSQMRFGVSAI
jgi:hypothetical protein